MTQLIQRLERQGLVNRLADPEDGRVALVAITEGGQALLDERTRTRRERLTALLATLTSEEVYVLWLSAQVALPILDQLVKKADLPAEGSSGQTGHRVPSSTMRATQTASAAELALGAGRITG